VETRAIIRTDARQRRRPSISPRPESKGQALHAAPNAAGRCLGGLGGVRGSPRRATPSSMRGGVAEQLAAEGRAAQEGVGRLHAISCFPVEGGWVRFSAAAGWLFLSAWAGEQEVGVERGEAIGMLRRRCVEAALDVESVVGSSGSEKDAEVEWPSAIAAPPAGRSDGAEEQVNGKRRVSSACDAGAR